jgi:hypothetical protein
MKVITYSYENGEKKKIAEFRIDEGEVICDNKELLEKLDKERKIHPETGERIEVEDGEKFLEFLPFRSSSYLRYELIP